MTEIMNFYFAHPALTTGGSEARVLHGLKALRGIGNRTLLTGRPVDFQRLNLEYQTDILPTEIDVQLPCEGSIMLGRVGNVVRLALFNRFIHKQAKDEGIYIGAYNLINFGRPAIQFIADFSFDDKLRLKYDPPAHGRGSFLFEKILRKIYLTLTRILIGPTYGKSSTDWVVANSNWIAEALKENKGIVCRSVIYPPVLCDAPEIPWAARRNSFVCLGRVSHEKRIERVINIIKKVRDMGHTDVELNIIGTIENDSYGRFIRKIISENSSWCFALGSMWGPKKFETLTQHKFAIHGRDGEAFGIAVAEQVRSGCIPFVPNSGGPAEIVATSALCYSDEADAVHKIDSILRHTSKQKEILQHLRVRGDLFSIQRFSTEFKKIVLEFAAEQAKIISK